MIQTSLNRLWHSPTFTSWGNKISASARLFLVLPLLLNRFDEVQLAAWFLFGSILFFGTLMAAQSNLVLSRMVSVAFGGAKDLEAISSNRRPETSGLPNWPLVERLYGSMGGIHLVNSLLGVIIALLLGWFSLSAVIQDYADAAVIWTAFFIFLLGQLLVQVFARYTTTLRGLNQVALTNRWEALFGLLSAASGGITLWLGGSIIHLAVVMQVFLLIGVLRQWALLMYVVEPRFKKVPVWRIDRQIMTWIWEPLWRSFIRAVANRGSSKVAAVVLARHVDPSVLTSMLLSLRLLETLEDIAVTPLTSHIPRLGRLLAQGVVGRFRSGVCRALRLSCFFQVAGIIAIAYCGYAGLALIGSESKLLGQTLFLILAFAHLLASQIRQSLMITVIGNNIIAVGRLSFSALLSGLLSVVLIPAYPIWGFIISAYLPLVFMLNLYPLNVGCELMQVPVRKVICSTTVIPWMCLTGALVISLFVPWETWSQQLAEYIITLW